MGFHICARPDTGYIHGKSEPHYPSTSSADHTLTFTNGHKWIMPSAILYYILDCGWQPDAEFIDDLMTQDLAQTAQTQQMRSISPQTPSKPRRIGYLDDDFVRTQLPTPNWNSAHTRQDICKKISQHIQNPVTPTFQTKGLRIKM